MKEMYLKVKVEDVKDIDFVDVFFRKGRYFTCPKDDEELVEIEDAENKGAEKLLYAINRIVFFINNNGKDKVEELFGHANIEMILREFAPHRIIELAKELEYHVPTTGDVYESRHSRSKVVVMHYDMKTESVQFMDDTCFSSITLNTLNKLYSFTGRNYNEFSSILNELKGDNT